MANRVVSQTLLGVCCLLALTAAGMAQNDGEFLAPPTWQPTSPEDAYGRLLEYLEAARIAPDRRAIVLDQWNSADGDTANGKLAGDLLDRLAAALAKADDRVAELVEHCAAMSYQGDLPEFAWLADSETPLLVRNNMRLFYARWLVQQGYYDEAVAWTDGLTTADVAAPHALLFYRAIAHQRLVEPDKAIAELGQLVTRRDQLPIRYRKLAELMEQDLAGLTDDSLDHIARRMEDVRRRLAQGRSGRRVQSVENGVIDSLDKLIKDIEDRMRRQQGAAAASAPRSLSPMPDSRIAEGKAPGKVEHRDIGDGAGWGNLPEKDREKALQDIGRDFPSHYREIIEEYFRRLAAEDVADQP